MDSGDLTQSSLAPESILWTTFCKAIVVNSVYKMHIKIAVGAQKREQEPQQEPQGRHQEVSFEVYFERRKGILDLEEGKGAWRPWGMWDAGKHEEIVFWSPAGVGVWAERCGTKGQLVDKEMPRVPFFFGKYLVVF